MVWCFLNTGFVTINKIRDLLKSIDTNHSMSSIFPEISFSNVKIFQVNKNSSWCGFIVNARVSPLVFLKFQVHGKKNLRINNKMEEYPWEDLSTLIKPLSNKIDEHHDKFYSF